MPTPIRYPNGVTNESPNSFLKMLPILNPSKHIIFFDDFLRNYAATDWVVGGAGTPARALDAATLTGALKVTTTGADNDSNFMQLSLDGGTTALKQFKLANGKKLWYETKIKVDVIDNTELIMGLLINDTDPFSAAQGFTDGVAFRVDDSTTLSNVDFIVVKNTTSITKVATIGSLVADTYVTLSFYWDGGKNVYYAYNGVGGVVNSSTNIVDDEALAISIALKNGEAEARNMYVDYILCVQER